MTSVMTTTMAVVQEGDETKSKVNDAATSHKRKTAPTAVTHSFPPLIFRLFRSVDPSFFISLSSIILFRDLVFQLLLSSLPSSLPPSLSRLLSLIPGAGPSPIRFHSSFRNYFIVVVVGRHFPKCALEFSDSSDIEIQTDESTLYTVIYGSLDRSGGSLHDALPPSLPAPP